MPPRGGNGSAEAKLQARSVVLDAGGEAAHELAAAAAYLGTILRQFILIPELKPKSDFCKLLFYDVTGACD